MFDYQKVHNELSAERAKLERLLMETHDAIKTERRHPTPDEQLIDGLRLDAERLRCEIWGFTRAITIVYREGMRSGHVEYPESGE